VYSFADTRIRAFGIAQSHAYEAPKPDEFGSAGRSWDKIGWRVEVSFQEIPTQFRPVEWIELLRPLLPAKYSPLLPDGRGVQSIYLTELPQPLALVLANQLGSEVRALARGESAPKRDLIVPNAEQRLWEDHLLSDIEQDVSLKTTEKEALVLARRGQGLFRKRVQEIEARCRITRVDRPEHLRASHCKPWRDADNAERLDGENGLLLTPSIDHLFDRGFISFRDDGRLLVSPVAHQRSISGMGVPVDGDFDAGSFPRGRRGSSSFTGIRCFWRRGRRRRSRLSGLPLPAAVLHLPRHNLGRSSALARSSARARPAGSAESAWIPPSAPTTAKSGCGPGS
jgi:hypothetical protein